MSASLTVLSVGTLAAHDLIPQLFPSLPGDDIHYFSLLSGLTHEQICAHYAADEDAPAVYTTLDDGHLMKLSRDRVAQALQVAITRLEAQGAGVIWLMTTTGYAGLAARQAVLLEGQRMVPPLVASIAHGYRVGVLLPHNDLQASQADKWQALSVPPLYATWDNYRQNSAALLAAGQQLLVEGAEVLVLDSPGYRPADRDMLEQQLDVPVLLSCGLMAKLAEELLV